MSLAVSDPNAPALALFGKARALVLSALFRRRETQNIFGKSLAKDRLARQPSRANSTPFWLPDPDRKARWQFAPVPSQSAKPLQRTVPAIGCGAVLIGQTGERGAGKGRWRVPKTRKSERLGLSAPYDWPNPDIPDDTLIAKAGSSLRFEDVAALCAHYGLDRVRSVLAKSAEGDLEKKILARQLKNIEAALAEEGDLAA